VGEGSDHFDVLEPSVQSLDAVVIGGGVIGLAAARALALRGREVVIVEAEPTLGSHGSSRNSEVIHAGLYYPTGSLKARTCVAGKQSLYAYCEARGVRTRRLGKLIVATSDEEMPVLERIRAQAVANGVEDLVTITAEEVRRREPAVHAAGALWSPSSGIVDSHGFMTALRQDLEGLGGDVVARTPVLGGEVGARGIELELGGQEPMRVSARVVVNAAGLWAPAVAHSLKGISETTIPAQRYAKGHYFTLSGRSPFSHLVYPVPVPGGLGTHVTLDLAGQARFGPDIEWIDSIDYSFDEARARAFYDAVRRYYPALKDGALAPGYTGIRSKVVTGSEPADFVIQGRTEHGVAGLVNLYGIESPGLTASLAIAELVADELL
jgi:L-2-hydroxyglutarate oxidase LhgO